MMPDEDTLYYWSLRYVRAIHGAERSMPDAHADAEIEYCEDNMRRHLNKDLLGAVVIKLKETYK